MRTKLTLATLAVALFAMSPVIAQDTSKSRAEVKKEAAAAARSTVGKGEADCAVIDEKSTRTREQVGAEARAAVKSGEGRGEYDCPPPSTASTKSRADVKAEAAKATKAGQIGKGEADIRK